MTAAATSTLVMRIPRKTTSIAGTTRRRAGGEEHRPGGVDQLVASAAIEGTLELDVGPRDGHRGRHQQRGQRRGQQGEPADRVRPQRPPDAEPVDVDVGAPLQRGGAPVHQPQVPGEQARERAGQQEQVQPQAPTRMRSLGSSPPVTSWASGSPRNGIEPSTASRMRRLTRPPPARTASARRCRRTRARRAADPTPTRWLPIRGRRNAPVASTRSRWATSERRKTCEAATWTRRSSSPPGRSSLIRSTDANAARQLLAVVQLGRAGVGDELGRRPVGDGEDEPGHRQHEEGDDGGVADERAEADRPQRADARHRARRGRVERLGQPRDGGGDTLSAVPPTAPGGAVRSPVAMT